jgi:exodeoxyribonuclease V alpha subunit
VIERVNRPKPNGITYDEVQLEAIRTAVMSKFMVLTGGPGTGKTTTTLGIIQAFQASGLRVLCAAPTGRAAKRMSEATGMEAKTIHRLLEFKPPQGYQRNADNPLEGDVLILDECSMIDIILMHNLLKAVPDDMTVIMVGDTDQLPSVGAGNVLNDIIASEVVSVVRLRRIFRQAQGSRIIMNAHRINQGKGIDITNGKTSDFFFIESTTPESAVKQIIDLVETRLPEYYQADPIRDIQVLTPMQRGLVGAVNLNRMLQERLNPTSEPMGKPSLSRAGMEYRLHDKVMQIKNDYDKDVFNGDIGTITDVNIEDQQLTITFDGRDIVYEKSDLDEVVLAYATTIHKSQGSEYPIVVLPFMMTHFVMLQRNLLYTAATRAKRVLVLVGERKAIGYAIRNQKPNERNTRLHVRLKNNTEK